MQATPVIAKLVAVALVSSVSVWTHTAVQGGGTPADKIVLEVGDHEMADLVEKMAEFLGENHLVDGGWARFAKLRGSGRYAIRLHKRMELDAKSCREVIPELLYTLGWVLTPIDEARGLFEWINVNDRRRGDIRARAPFLDRDEVLANTKLHRYVITSLTLDKVSVKELAPTLAALSKDNKLLDLMPVGGDTNSIIIGGLGAHVAPMVELLKRLDRHLAPRRPNKSEGNKD